MKKSELVKNVVAETNLNKRAVELVIESIFNNIFDSVKKDGKFQLAGIGTFSLKERAARDGINPKTKEKIKIKASKSIGFKPAKKVKENL